MEIPDCTKCGLCCSGKGIKHNPYLDIRLTLKETYIHDGHYRHRIGGNENELGFWLNRRDNGDCTYWNPKTKLCTAYERRPEKCRNFARGCKYCVELINLD